MYNKPTKPYLGAAYYPEVLGLHLVDEDIARMKECGINIVRIGEFAWSTIEPEEGKFDFSAFHAVIEKLKGNGIAVVMCTPSVTPPCWLTKKYPEVLNVYENGVRSTHGARCHVCKSSKKMREKNAIIVERICREFADEPAIAGWQIDNEIYPYDGGCHCQNCQNEFRKYLKTKYGDIKTLNKKWYNARWSLDYTDFEDIIPPRKDTWNNPTLQTEWAAFQSELICGYVKEQADIIHRYSGAPVGTDMMPMLGEDYYAMNANLDVVQFNHYEPEQWLVHSAFWFDYLRPIKNRPFWVTETQFGWNGSAEAGTGFRHPGNCYMNTWLPYICGAETNMFWHFRAHVCGHEIAHGAIISAQGRFNYPIEELKKVSRELAEFSDLLGGTRVKADVALSLSCASWRNLNYAPLIEKLDYKDTVMNKYYRNLLNYAVDIIDTPHSLEGYKVLVSPFLTDANRDRFKERVLAWVREGGRWIVGPMTDVYTDYASKFPDKPYSFLEEAGGVYSRYTIPQDGEVTAVWESGERLECSTMYEGFELRGAKSLAKYTYAWLNGLSAVTEIPCGKGKIIVMGTVVGKEALQRLVEVPPIAEASDNIKLVVREGGGKRYIFAAELYGREGKILLDGSFKELISGNVLSGEVTASPFGVLILEKISG